MNHADGQIITKLGRKRRMRLAWIASALVGSTVAAHAFDEQAVAAKCAADWSADFAMQKFCRDQAVKAHSEATDAWSTSTAQRMPAEAFDKCRADWTNDWVMIAFCTKQQIDAFSTIADTTEGLSPDVASQINTKCAADWSSDFVMQKFCAEQQAEAFKALQ
ncbi:hypothetical protein [Tateyamaria sp. syn59]|uniref:hypothetical protein n=1 Tax=Tateyamaria sp. syn59 TaxID=2576942 RepID=UPI0011BF6DD0|nr:hypothetical protein [Tateyamaria sp. syn59]